MKRESTGTEKGQALFLVVLLSVIVLAAGAAIIQTATLNNAQTRNNRLDEQLLASARTGLAHGKFQVWEKLQLWKSAPEIADVRRYLDQLGLAEGAKFTDPDGAFVLAQLELDSGNDTPGIDVSSERIYIRILAERHDLNNDTYLVVRSVATTWDTGPTGGADPQADRAARLAKGLPADQRVSEAVYRYGGVPFAGFEYALLTNAVNCMFCHTDIDNSERYYNPGTGEVERVKVASLQQLRLLQGPYARLTDTRIAGTLLVQGFSLDIYGNPLEPEDAQFFESRPFTDGINLDEDPTVNSNDPDDYFPGVAAFVDAGRDEDGRYDDPNANLYKQYPSDPATQEGLAGRLPDSFPPVIEDTDGDRHVGAAEWDAHVRNSDNEFNGRLSAGNVLNSGGAFVKIPGNSSYDHNALPDGRGASGENEHAGEIQGRTVNASVILVGTEDDPILINGNVAIDGDVILSGVVQGNGQLLVRGNLYLPGDVRYNDGTSAGARTFGVAPDGTTQNAVAYAAGGAIIHGEYLTTNDGSPYTGEDRSESGRAFTNNELGLWNREEYANSVPYIDSASKWPTPDARDANGNTNQPNPLYKQGYKPRYYTTRDGGNIWLYGAETRTRGGQVIGSKTELVPVDTNGDGTPDSARWDSSNTTNLGDIQRYAYDESETLATVSGTHRDPVQPSSYTTLPINPSWMSEEDMRALTVKADDARAASPENGKPFRLDGLFYTHNGMLFMARSTTSSGGKLEFNGSVVAADTGILPGSHLQLNYDARTKEYLEIETDKEVGFYLVTEREGHTASNE